MITWFIARQWLAEHVSAAKDTYAIILEIAGCDVSYVVRAKVM
jgi:hypothetical protein